LDCGKEVTPEADEEYSEFYQQCYGCRLKEYKEEKLTAKQRRLQERFMLQFLLRHPKNKTSPT